MRMKPLAAFLVAPIPAAILQSLVVALWPKVGRGVFEHPASMFVTICLYGYAVWGLLGLPAAAWLRRRGATSIKAYALLGLAAWLVPLAIGLIAMLVKGQLSLYVAIYNLAFFGAGGLAAGALFRWASRPARDILPDPQASS